MGAKVLTVVDPPSTLRVARAETFAVNVDAPFRLARVLAPAMVAEAIVFLASDAASFVYGNAAGIAKLQKLGYADPALAPDLTASILGGMVEHMTHLWFIHNEPYDEDVATEALTRVWANALRLSVE